MENRREFIWSLGAAAMCFGGAGRASALEQLEHAANGRFGVAAWNRVSDATVLHRADERFVMCSTFKWILGGLILRRVDDGREELARHVSFSRKDLVSYSPVTSKRVKAGMSVDALCKAAIQASDNAAANLLLAPVGGPAGFTAAVRTLGDTTTRLDDYEPQLNANPPGVKKNTTTPRAMLFLLRRFVLGPVLSDTSRQRLIDWMVGSKTGSGRLRAGIENRWTVGNKTGTSRANQSNDVAFALQDEKAILMVSFHHVPGPLTRTADARHAAVARHVMKTFAKAPAPGQKQTE